MNILIVEDEKVSARRLKRIIDQDFESEEHRVEIRNNIETAEEYIENNPIELLFLDLNLNGKNGFNILKTYSSESFQTIIVSAYSDEAITAFEYGVLDFIPKPFNRERVHKALNRLGENPEGINGGMKSVVIRNQGKLSVIPLEDIDYFKGGGDYTEIHLMDSSFLLHSKTLEALHRLLPDTYFRIHKSFLVDSKRIQNIIPHGGGKFECELDNGTRLPVSRSRNKPLKEALGII